MGLRVLDLLSVKWNVTPLLGEFGGRVGIYKFLHSPPIPRLLPSLFICRDLSFCPFNHVHAHLQAQGLAQGTAMSACTGRSEKKMRKLWALSFYQFKGGCGNTNPLSLRKFPLWKIVESPWKEGKIRLQVDKSFCFNYQ